MNRKLIDKEIAYTIIIPHKNIPYLLQRCLNSIPIRDDVQVIVVDDNSDADIVDFSNFPTWDGTHYETYYSKISLLAGGARNLGMRHATGLWLTFLDADDILTPSANDLFDKYKDSYSDMIRFGLEIRDCDTLVLSQEEHWYTKMLLNPNMTDFEKCINLTIGGAALYKSTLVFDNHIIWGKENSHNDTVFVTQAVLAAKQIEVKPDESFYVWSERRNSISRSQSKESIVQHFYTDKRKFQLVRKSKIPLSHLSNYQLEHLRNIRSLTLFEQIPIIIQMLFCGMLFNYCIFEPISTMKVIKFMGRTICYGIKNLVRMWGFG